MNIDTSKRTLNKIPLKELDHEYIKTNNEIEQLEKTLRELKDHKVRLRFFYDKYYKEKQ